MATISFTGNLTDDLNLRFGADSGKAWAVGRAVENFQESDGNGGYKQLRGIGRNFIVFGKQAENAAETLTKGARVHIEGREEPNDYTTDDGHVESTRIVVTSITPSLDYATAQVTKNPKANQAAPAAETSAAK